VELKLGKNMNMAAQHFGIARQGLYNPEHEHDSCGVGFIAQVSGRRSNRILRIGLRSICSLMHRGALDADAKTGDGAGVVTQIPYKLFVPEVTRLGHTLYKEGDLGVGACQGDYPGSPRETGPLSFRLA
jgi:glutamate synthase domain-containing protein 1